MKNLFLSLLLLVISACSTTIKDFEKYEKASLAQTEFMPSESELTKKLPVIAVLEFETQNAQAKEIGATKFTQESIVNIIVSHKLAEVVDRTNLTKLEEEIKLAEATGNSNGSHFKVMDFAIDGDILSLSFDSRFISEMVTHDGSILPARYEYTSKVQGLIKIYSMPDLSIVESISFAGYASKTETVNPGMIQARNFKISAPVKPKSFDMALAQEAVKNAIRNNEYKIKSVFAKSGYVLEKRVLHDRTIFLISIGRKDGIKQEDKIEFINKYSEVNPLTQQSEIRTRLITNGIVADRIEEDRAWIVIQDQTKASQVKLGDLVKVIYTK